MINAVKKILKVQQGKWNVVGNMARVVAAGRVTILNGTINVGMMEKVTFVKMRKTREMSRYSLGKECSRQREQSAQKPGSKARGAC